MSKILVSADVDVETVVDCIVEEPYDTIFKVIVDLDNRVADWDFTKRLAEHFKAEMAKYELDVGLEAQS